MRYLTSQDILAIHDQIVETIGGAPGVREPELLKSIAAKPKATFGGDELYPTLLDKTASIYEAICNYHVFIDGNKRTAAIVMYRFMSINEYELTATNDELENFTLKLATTHPDLADVAAWVKAHSRPL